MICGEEKVASHVSKSLREWVSYIDYISLYGVAVYSKWGVSGESGYSDTASVTISTLACAMLTVFSISVSSDYNKNTIIRGQ